jgi:hypothetical protein
LTGSFSSSRETLEDGRYVKWKDGSQLYPAILIDDFRKYGRLLDAYEMWGGERIFQYRRGRIQEAIQ